MKIRRAIKRLEAFFHELKTRPGVLARQLLGQELPGDRQLADLLCNERRALTRMDGSIQGSVFQTAWAAWELMDLGVDVLNGGLDRLVSWVLGRFEGGGATPAPSRCRSPFPTAWCSRPRETRRLPHAV